MLQRAIRDPGLRRRSGDKPLYVCYRDGRFISILSRGQFARRSGDKPLYVCYRDGRFISILSRGQFARPVHKMRC